MALQSVSKSARKPVPKPAVPRPRGRPRSESAVSHEVILDAVYELLHEKSVCDLTIEEVAKKAGVGKPTIYKWWPNKAALVLAMFEERVVSKFAVPDAKSAEQLMRTQVTELIRALNGFFGKVVAEIIGEGQGDVEVLREYRDRYVHKRRAVTREAIERAIASGEFKRKIDPEFLIDLIYGPIYYRLLVQHQKVDQRFGQELVDAAMRWTK